LLACRRSLGFGFFIPFQALGSQPVHVFNDSRTASRLLPQRLIDFRFAPLIAVEYTFSDLASLWVSHKGLSVVARSPHSYGVWETQNKLSGTKT
jgi:hypothetical protein